MTRVECAALVAAVFVVVVPVACTSTEAGEHVSFNTVDADPDWSPDGRLIVFASSRGAGGIYVINADGGGLRLLWRGEASDVDWSPDGRMIAFAGEDGIYVLKTNARGPRRVLRGASFSLPAWAPGGDRLAVVKQEEDFSSAIHVVQLDGRRSQRLLRQNRGGIGVARPGSISARSETEPSWSPDGRHIAFQAGDGWIVAASLEDGTRRVIARGGAYEPAWSPDGKLIAYQCEGQVCVANADGSGEVRQLATDGGDPSWAPDSHRLVFEHYLYGGSFFGSEPQSLSVVDIRDDGPRKLTFGEFTSPRP